MDGKIRQNEFLAAPPRGNERQWTAAKGKIRHKRIFGHASAGMPSGNGVWAGGAATSGNGRQDPTQTELCQSHCVAMDGNERQDPTQDFQPRQRRDTVKRCLGWGSGNERQRTARSGTTTDNKVRHKRIFGHATTWQ